MEAMAALSSAMTMSQLQLAAATKVARIANQQGEQVLALLESVMETAAPASEPGLGEQIDVYT